jgi:hypothetical protein
MNVRLLSLFRMRMEPTSTDTDQAGYKYHVLLLFGREPGITVSKSAVHMFLHVTELSCAVVCL